MAEPSLALHKAILAKLNELSTPVYDGVPQGTSYPYIVVDSSMVLNVDHLVERVQERFVFLSIWSQARGQAEVLGILGAIDALMNGVRLTLDTGTSVSVRMDQASTRRDADGVTFMGSVTLRIITKH